jgi:hypothetical protein
VSRIGENAPGVFLFDGFRFDRSGGELFRMGKIPKFCRLGSRKPMWISIERALPRQSAGCKVSQ